ncbi:MAG: hypothetical protein KGK30_10065, partial [Elusimicrobia bacterium]|nr:hypothetical protein [Elusimicrobiota bacterium]
LQKLGQYEQAEAAWKLVVQEDPRDAKARASLRFVSRRVLAKRRSARAKPGRRRRSGRKR